MARNVLLVTIDSLRTDYTSLFDTSVDYTGALQETATNGVSFDQAYATGPGTSPSFPALLTGTMPLSYGGLGPLREDRPRVAEKLGEAGLSTGGFQCNPFLSAAFGYDEGFDRFEDYQNPLMGLATRLFPRGIELNDSRWSALDDHLHITDGIKKSYQLLKGKPRPYVSAEVITDDALSWLAETSDPFFGWVHYMDVHHPCYPPRQYRARFGVESVSQSQVSALYSRVHDPADTLDETDIDVLRRLYAAAIDYTDDQFGRLLNYLRESGRFEDTLVVVTSDHGELFGEHGACGKPERMYDELLHVPLVVANGPDRLSMDRDRLVSLLDVPPTIHDALDIGVPSVYDGRVIGTDPPRQTILAEHEVRGEVIVGARSTEWLYEADGISDEHRVFDVSEGAFERTELVDSATPVRDAALDRLAALDVEASYLSTPIDDDTQSRLQDLGYL